MKFARFFADGEEIIRNGIVFDSCIREISGSPFLEWTYTGKEFPLSVKFAPPLRPNHVIGIGKNYVGNLEELATKPPSVPMFFFKPVSSVIGPQDTIVIPGENIIVPEKISKVVYESELAVVIGKRVRRISESEVDDAIFGFTIGNDVTATQFLTGTYGDGFHAPLGKSFDTFTPLGPVIETDIDMDSVFVESYLNGVRKQRGSTELMIVPIRKMISYWSHVMTLSPGDVILTGTPNGADFVRDGDVVECKIKGIGTLRNKVLIHK